MKIKLCLWLLSFLLISESRAEAVEIFQDSFEGSISKEWVVRPGSETSSFEVNHEQAMKGEKALKVNFSSGEFALLEKKFATVQKNVLVRAFLYDEYDLNKEFGAMLTVRENENQGGTGLGVLSSHSRDYYVMRVDGAATMKGTKIKRSRGWHMLELIITDKGTYGKIDGTLINIDPEQNRTETTPKSEFWLNPNLTGLGIVQLGQSWKVWGRSYWDEVVVVTEDSGSWEEMFWRRFDSYNDIYRNTDMSQVIGPITAEISSRYTRHRGDMAVYFYLYGIKHNDQSAKNKGINLLNELIRDFNDIHGWVRGGSLLPMVRATYLMKDDLDRDILERFKIKMKDQANIILNTKSPLSGYKNDTKAEENAWDAAFLASMANYFPEIPEGREWEERARCMAFHSITTNENYCGKTTQTVYKDYTLENHNIISPMYANGTILMLAVAAQSYELTGKEIPSEYFHNVKNLYDYFIKPHIDFNNYYWKDVLSDWAGVWNTFEVYGLSVLDFVEKAGGSTGVNRTDYMKKMSLFAYKIPGNYTRGKRMEDVIINNPSLQVYKDFSLNTIIAGEYYSTVALNLGLLNTVIEPTVTTVPTKILSPTLPPSLCSQCSDKPEAKLKGDADCSGGTSLNDSSIWRSEFISGNRGTIIKNNWRADFDCNGKVTLIDASIWRGNFIKSLIK